MTTRTAAAVIEEYLARFRLELSFLGTAEVNDLVAEIRSLLVDAAGDDAERAEAEIGRLGDPAELAAGIMAERGLDAEKGLTVGSWWRLGIAATIDILIGLSVPLIGMALAYLAVTSEGASTWAVAAFIAFAIATLGWPLYVWRPWQGSGHGASVGMTLTDLAVVKTPTFRRVVRSSELKSMGLSVPRRSALSGILTLVLAVVLVLLALQLAGMSGGKASPSLDVTGDPTAQLTDVVRALYLRAGVGDRPVKAGALSAEAADALERLAAHVRAKGITTLRFDGVEQVGTGVYSLPVTEFSGPGLSSGPLGTTTFRIARQVTAETDGYTAGWIVVGIDVPGDTTAP